MKDHKARHDSGFCFAFDLAVVFTLLDEGVAV